MYNLISKKKKKEEPTSTRRRTRRNPGAAGGWSVIDHAASTQYVIINKKCTMNTHPQPEKINIYLSNSLANNENWDDQATHRDDNSIRLHLFSAGQTKSSCRQSRKYQIEALTPSMPSRFRILTIGCLVGGHISGKTAVIGVTQKKRKVRPCWRTKHLIKV